jgi:hypothetical protein
MVFQFLLLAFIIQVVLQYVFITNPPNIKSAYLPEHVFIYNIAAAHTERKKIFHVIKKKVYPTIKIFFTV